MIHELKTWPKYFKRVHEGTKTFECRFNDRDFQINDRLRLVEFDPEKKELTGNVILARVDYILSEYEGLKDGYVIMAITITR